MPEELPTTADLALEQSGLEFLRSGKFRKARDAFKALNKTQPTRALPLLIEANLGLINDMMSKGLVSEANQVTAYLKTIAPASYNLDLTATTKSKTSGDAWSAMVSLAARRLATTTQPDAAIRAADEMILGAESPEHPGHPDAAAILSALELGYGAAASERTTPLLRSVPRSSPFSHWVLFFKGMTALETGNHARAADCFLRVPENSLLQASIPALLTICNAPAIPRRAAPRTVRAICAWAGHPGLAEPLLVAEPLWRKNQRAKAFTVLAKKIPNLMRWGARGFKPDLTRFLTREFARESFHSSTFCDAMLAHVSSKAYTIARAALDQAYFTMDFAGYPCDAHEHFHGALHRLNNMPGVVPISPAMRSRVFTLLAENYIAAIKNDPSDLCNPPIAKKALEHAIKYDPDHLHAWLTLCDLLSMGRDTSAYHRFLDDLTKRFPAEKEVLIRNGDCCIGRGSHTKALRNFERAAKLDSIDPRIARGILRSRLGIAEAAYKKRQPSKVDWDLIESLASANQACPKFSLWRLRVNKLVLAARYGAKEEVLVDLAAAILPLSPGAFQFEVACHMGIARRQTSFSPEIMEKMLPVRPAPQSLADFLAVIDEVEASEEGAVYDSAKNAARWIFAEHRELLCDFVTEQKDLITLLIKIFSSRIPSLGLVSPLIEKWFASVPSDPFIRCLCALYMFPWLPDRPAEDLDNIMDEIRASQNPDTLRLLMLLEKERKRLAERRGRREAKSAKLDLDYDPYGTGGEYDDEDGYDDNDYAKEELAALDRAAAKMSSEELRAAIAGLLDAGAGRPQDSGPGFATPGKPSLKKTESDPNQLDLESLFKEQLKP